MSSSTPNYTDMNFASSMGPKLQQLVESQLLIDLKNYGVDRSDLRFDWSDSCIEGHRTNYLDGSLENFSGIAVFDDANNIVADGWMEFIHEGSFFLVYWQFVTTWKGDEKLGEKKDAGIPEHVWQQIPDSIKPNYSQDKVKASKWL